MKSIIEQIRDNTDVLGTTTITESQSSLPKNNILCPAQVNLNGQYKIIIGEPFNQDQGGKFMKNRDLAIKMFGKNTIDSDCFDIDDIVEKFEDEGPITLNDDELVFVFHPETRGVDVMLLEEMTILI